MSFESGRYFVLLVKTSRPFMDVFSEPTSNGDLGEGLFAIGDPKRCSGMSGDRGPHSAAAQCSKAAMRMKVSGVSAIIDARVLRAGLGIKRNAVDQPFDPRLHQRIVLKPFGEHSVRSACQGERDEGPSEFFGIFFVALPWINCRQNVPECRTQEELGRTNK
jgi:hypothetical protein